MQVCNDLANLPYQGKFHFSHNTDRERPQRVRACRDIAYALRQPNPEAIRARHGAVEPRRETKSKCCALRPLLLLL